MKLGSRGQRVVGGGTELPGQDPARSTQPAPRCGQDTAESRGNRQRWTVPPHTCLPALPAGAPPRGSATLLLWAPGHERVRWTLGSRGSAAHAELPTLLPGAGVSWGQLSAAVLWSQRVHSGGLDRGRWSERQAREFGAVRGCSLPACSGSWALRDSVTLEGGRGALHSEK